MVTTYGIISDIHTTRHLSTIEMAFRTLVALGAEKFILNGDLVGDQTGADPVKYLKMVLGYAVATQKEVYAQLGSHEESNHFLQAVQSFRLCDNLVNMLENPLVQNPDHDLVFLPGSDWHGAHVRGNGYSLQSGDLRKYVRDADKTIVVCHVPAKFNSLEQGVDMAYFAEHSRGGLMPGIVLENDIREQCGGSLSMERVQQIARQHGFTFKRENRGNEELARVFKELGITKAINGHFHESAHRAHDLRCNPVAQGELSPQLFWNASYVDDRRIGLLTVDENKVKYQNILF